MADIAWMKMAETLIPTKFDLPRGSITFDFIVNFVIEIAIIRGIVT
jgi:hypothetical protein